MIALTDRFAEAMAFAFQLHHDQERKGTGTPYVGHLLGVASLVLEYGGDEDQAIAGLLHDAVEDQGGNVTLGLIRDKFGDRVASIVDACSDQWGEPELPWREVKEATLAAIPTVSAEARLVELCDKIYNCRSLLRAIRVYGDQVTSRFTGQHAGLLWYYTSLADAFDQVGPAPAAVELRRLVDELQALLK